MENTVCKKALREPWNLCRIIRYRLSLYVSCADGYAAPGKESVPDDWSTQDKFLVVAETAGMNETELAEYARKKGLYVANCQGGWAGTINWEAMTVPSRKRSWIVLSMMRTRSTLFQRIRRITDPCVKYTGWIRH